MEALHLLLLFLLSIVLALLSKTKSSRKTPPGPAGLPLIGNMHQLTGKHSHECFWDLSKKHGPLLFLKFGSRPVLVANSSRIAEEILKKQDLLFCSRPPLRAMRKLSYDGLDIVFAPFNEGWREMRKVSMLHLLSTTRVKSFRPIREDEVSRMMEKISEQSSRSDVVNLSEEIMFMTSTIITRLAFGKRYEQGSGDRRDFIDIISEFKKALSSFYFSDYFSWLEWFDRITGKIEHLEKTFRQCDVFCQQLINEHQSMDRPKSMDGDVVDIMLKLREETSSGSIDLSMDRIKAVLTDVYVAATDTIATTIIWAMTALIKNPSAMNMARAELRSIGKKQMLDEEDITAADLPYFRAAIREALRMYAPLPLLLRETMTKCTIDGYEIPEKTMVHVNIWAIGRDPELWENPNEFCPERFLTGENKLNMDFTGQDFSVLPFGAGRRGCPGITMALATVELAIANLVYVFEWEVPDGMRKEDVDMEALPGLSLDKKNALCLVAKRLG